MNNVSNISAIGHYSLISEVPNGMIFLSGQKAWKPGGGDAIVGSIEMQTGQVLDNIETILESIGLDLSSLVRIQCFLARVSDYQRFDAAYATRLGGIRPARYVVGGVELRGGALVELIAEAYRKNPLE